MVRFKATTGDGRVLIGLGITSANVARMAQGEPIHVKGESVNTPGIDICIFYGKSLEDLQNRVRPIDNLPCGRVHAQERRHGSVQS